MTLNYLLANRNWLSFLAEIPIALWLIGAAVIGAIIWWKVHWHRFETNRSIAISAAVGKTAIFNRTVSRSVSRLANRFRLIQDLPNGWTGMNEVDLRLPRNCDQRPNGIYVMDYQFRISEGDSEDNSTVTYRRNMILIQVAEDWPEIFIKPQNKPLIPLLGSTSDPQPVLESSKYELHLKPGHTIDKPLAEEILQLLEASSASCTVESFPDSILMSISGQHKLLRNDSRFEPEQIPCLMDFALQFDQLSQKYLMNVEIVEAAMVDSPESLPNNPRPPIK